MQTRPTAGASICRQAEAIRLSKTKPTGNAVVVTRLLADKDRRASVRTVERAVGGRLRQPRVAMLATVRFETGPGAPS